MPTYQYVCTACGTPHEAQQSFSDATLVECPTCQGRLRKVFSAVGVVFKGSGFYRNDSRGPQPDSSDKNGKNETSEKGDKGDKGDKGSTADKPEKPAAPDKADKADKAGSGAGSGKQSAGVGSSSGSSGPAT